MLAVCAIYTLAGSDACFGTANAHLAMMCAALVLPIPGCPESSTAFFLRSLGLPDPAVCDTQHTHGHNVSFRGREQCALCALCSMTHTRAPTHNDVRTETDTDTGHRHRIAQRHTKAYCGSYAPWDLPMLVIAASKELSCFGTCTHTQNTRTQNIRN